MTIFVKLPRQIDDVLASDIEKEAAFISPHLSRLVVNPERTEVSVEVNDQAHEQDVQGKVDRFLDAMMKRTHSFDTKVFMETQRRDSAPYETGVHQGLQERGWLHDYGDGRVALSGPALRLAKLVDHRARALYEGSFNVIERDFPAMIDADLLKRCGYFDSHPNAVCFVGHVVEDFDAIEEFRTMNTESDSPAVLPSDHIHMPGMCLNPAACFPCYPTLKGQQLDGDGQILTWRGRVFRFESRNVSGLDRLWEFNVREIVFAGAEDYVADCRKQAMPLVAELAEWLDLDCQIETAADPFFATVSAAKTFWQRAQEVKNEIMLPVGYKDDGTLRRIASGSINLHGNFFGDRFDFTAADVPAFTACIGLGIERWVLAGFVQHGFDAQRWPRAVRDKIF